MMELEAGLAEGPRTATTPLDMIWHTERKQREGVGGKIRIEGLRRDGDSERGNKSDTDIQQRESTSFLE